MARSPTDLAWAAITAAVGDSLDLINSGLIKQCTRVSLWVVWGRAISALQVTRGAWPQASEVLRGHLSAVACDRSRQLHCCRALLNESIVPDLVRPSPVASAQQIAGVADRDQ